MQNSWCWKYSAISIYQVITATPCCCCAVMQVRRGTLKSSGDKSTCCAQSALTFDSKLVNVPTETMLEQFPNVSVGPAMKICSTFGIFGKPTTTTNAPCHHLVDDGWVILQICKSANRHWKIFFYPSYQQYVKKNYNKSTDKTMT